MTDTDLTERVAQIIYHREIGYAYDALDLEVKLWRDLAAEAYTAYHEAQGGRVQGHLKRVVAAERALG